MIGGCSCLPTLRLQFSIVEAAPAHRSISHRSHHKRRKQSNWCCSSQGRAGENRPRTRPVLPFAAAVGAAAVNVAILHEFIQISITYVNSLRHGGARTAAADDSEPW